MTNLESGQSYDLEEVGQRVLILHGGVGGVGNEHFKSSTNRAPRESTLGKTGQNAEFQVELQLFADIGLVGFPNAGKSTVLDNLTNAKSPVGAYEFTTLDPHLGALRSGVIIADLPGLIHGASEGRGLGHKFLRHIKRTKCIAHVISLEYYGALAERFAGIIGELEKYDQTLLEKKYIIILTKSDLLDKDKLESVRQEIENSFPDIQYFFVSQEDAGSFKILGEELGRMF